MESQARMPEARRLFQNALEVACSTVPEARAVEALRSDQPAAEKEINRCHRLCVAFQCPEDLSAGGVPQFDRAFPTPAGKSGARGIKAYA